MKNKIKTAIVITNLVCSLASANQAPAEVGNLAVLPEDPKAVLQLNRPIPPGPCNPTWDSLGNYFKSTPPTWWRDAKIGFWIHWGPQSQGRTGDWYARFLYQPVARPKYYENHLKDFGHPSESGYKEVLRAWQPKHWDPAELMSLYKKAGAGYVLIMGCHHDNFDLWDSKYQPWNSVNVGPKRDILAGWVKEAKQCGLRYGVSFHSDYSWYWYQTAFQSDPTGPKAGVPYDAATITKESGKGTWWEGLDPKDLYGINLKDEMLPGKDPSKDFGGWGCTKQIFTTPQVREFANWYVHKWYDRTTDVIDHYHPDFIYFDGCGYPFAGNSMTGRGIASDAMARVAAYFYNRQAEWNGGHNEGLIFTKGADNPNAVMQVSESNFPADIQRRPWAFENGLGEWFYEAGTFYDSGMVIHEMLEAVSRDGNFQVNIPIDPDGQLDAGGRQVLEDMASWMAINAQGIKGSSAWLNWGEGSVVMSGGNLKKPQAETPYTAQDIRFTVGKDKALYAWLMAWPANGEVTIHSIKKTECKVETVSLLGSKGKLSFEQTADGLVVKLSATTPSQFVSGLKITGKNLLYEVNSLYYYDPNLKYTGKWETNNKTAFTSTAGLSAEATFNGTGFQWYGMKAADHGMAQVSIDDQPPVVVDCYAKKRDRSLCYAKTDLPAGPHKVSITVLKDRNPLSTGGCVEINQIDVISRAN